MVDGKISSKNPSSIDTLDPCFNYILYINIMSCNKEEAGHLHAVATEELVEIGLSLQTLIKEHKTFMFYQVHRQNKDIDKGLFFFDASLLIIMNLMNME